MPHLGEELKSYREGRNMTQPQMAEYLQIAYRTYQALEKTGVVKKSAVALKIAEKTGLDTQKYQRNTQESMDALIQTNRDLAESNKSLARSHEKLVAMMEANSIAQRESHASDTSNFENLADGIAAIGVHVGFWEDVQTALEAIGSRSVFDQMAKKAVGKKKP